jgi:hypothetical protein
MTVTREIVPTATNRNGITAEGRWLSIRQIAADLGVSTSTVYKPEVCRGCPAPFACTTETFG